VAPPNGDGKRRGDDWKVTQDFADRINPASPSLTGQHLGEDWIPISRAVAGRLVCAIADGVVIVAERNRSYGEVVMIPGFLNPTNAGSLSNDTGGGWLDTYVNR